MKLRALVAALALAAGFAAVQPASAEQISGNYYNAGGRVVPCLTETPIGDFCVNGYAFGPLGQGSTWRIELKDEAGSAANLPVGGRLQFGSTSETLPNLPVSIPFCGSQVFTVPNGLAVTLFLGGEAPANCALASTPGIAATFGTATIIRL